MKTFKKINLFYNGDYVCSTMQSKTCKAAKATYLERAEYYKPYNGIVDKQILKNPELLKAYFAKGE